MFHDIPEFQNEKCVLLIKQFIPEDPGITEVIQIDGVHRLGKPKGKTRPIGVKCHEYQQRELVLTTANDKFDELKKEQRGR